MTPDQPEEKGQPGLGQVALFGLCPRCGARGLFNGVAQFAPSCGACGLDYTTFNVGDGPAAFLTMIIGAFDVVLALWLFFRFQLPVWVIITALVPITFGLVLWGLRLSKAALLAAEFRRRAFEAGSRDLRDE